MDAFHPLLAAGDFLDPKHLIESVGTIGLIIIIFLESCFAPLPGDSLLFVAGIFVSTGDLDPIAVFVGCTIAAILGNQAGYWFGRKMGPALFNKPNSRLFKAENVKKTEAYFERFGARTILLARVIPIVRGLAPIVAGVGNMQYRKFVFYNILGGILWIVTFVTLGWALGDTIGADNIDKYVLPLAAIVVIVTTIPLVVEYQRSKKKGTPEHELLEDTPI